MNRKGQVFWELLLAIFIVVIVSLIFTGLTKLFVENLNGYLLFLGWLFFLAGIIFSFVLHLDVGFRGIIVGGGAAAVFFILAWLVPKICAIELFP